MNLNLSNSITLFLIITCSVIAGNFISSYLITKSDQFSGRIKQVTKHQPHNRQAYKAPNVVRPVLSNQDLCDFWKEHIKKQDNSRNRELLRRSCTQ